MENRGEATRLAAAKTIVTALTVLVGLAVIVGLISIFFKLVSESGYRPQNPQNSVVCAAIFVSGLLSLRWSRTSLRRSVVFYSLFNTAIIGMAIAGGYQRYAESGKSYDMSSALYVPHLGILLVAFIAGKRAALITAAGGVIYLIFMNQFLPTWTSLGLPIIIALALPFTAVLVERLLDEVEKETRRARLAETSIDIMTHDLGNPLAVLSASLEMLEERELPPEQWDTLMRAIRRNTRTLNNLLGEFRDTCRLSEAIPMRSVNLHSLTHDVVELYARPMCDKRGLTLQANLQPVEVIGAPSRLGRVVRELLTNAIKYTPRGGTIEVTLHATDEVILRVSDDGWGIKEEELTHVFEQHWRGATVSQEDMRGRGLGLFICKSIVESHGGRIRVASQENRGSTFTVHLPLPDAAEESSPLEVEYGREEVNQPQDGVPFPDSLRSESDS
jgi:signal transduction histidine kinase